MRYIIRRSTNFEVTREHEITILIIFYGQATGKLGHRDTPWEFSMGRLLYFNFRSINFDQIVLKFIKNNGSKIALMEVRSLSLCSTNKIIVVDIRYLRWTILMIILFWGWLRWNIQVLSNYNCTIITQLNMLPHLKKISITLNLDTLSAFKKN